MQFYKRLLALRHHNRALLDGQYIELNPDDPHLLSYLRKYKVSYLRKYKDQTVLVVLNMSAERQKAKFDLSRQGFRSAKSKALVTTSNHNGDWPELSLEPFGVYIGEITD